MLRLIRYLKPYWLMVVLAIGLLYAQAMADLALPNYMSDIVNVGIQQGGVENAVPEVIRQSQMDRVLLFLDDDEAEMVLANYTLVDESFSNYDQLLQNFPIAESEQVYVLNDITQEEIDVLNPVMGKSLLTVYMLEQIMEDPSLVSQFGGDETGFDLSQIPAGMDIFTVLPMLPEAQLTEMKNSMNGRFEVMGDSMVVQSASVAIKAEYEALGADLGKLQTSYILRIGSMMILLTLAGAACTITVGFLSARTAAAVARDLRHAIFSKVESFSKAEFESFSTASLITRSTNDITQVQMVVVMMLRMVFYAPIIGVGAIINATAKSPSMTWIIGLGVAVLLVVILVVFSVALPRFKRIQSLIDRLNLVSRENLSGMMVIRAFNTQNFELKRFDKANVDLTENTLFVSRVMVVMMPVMMLIMNGLSLLIIWVGSHQVADAAMQVGDMMAFLQYAMQVVFSFLMMSMMFIFLPRAAVSGGRIADVLEIETVINDPTEPKSFPSDSRGLVEFRDVCFRYPDAEECVLNHITFTAKPGETTAIIGSTGSVKSTIVNLIPRFFDVTEGKILVDGVDIREVTQKDLRDRIGYIPQQGMLFSGTIESNLRYGDDEASEEELQHYAEIAQASEFISKMEGGMQSEIAQGGTNVSGGQKQRLAIARALVKHPPIYIFDDALSALDFKTDAALRRALKAETGDSTMIIVTQRVATVKTADQILVIDDGEIVGKGTHQELMESCETYQQIAASQLSKEELK